MKPQGSRGRCAFDPSFDPYAAWAKHSHGASLWCTGASVRALRPYASPVSGDREMPSTGSPGPISPASTTRM